MHKCQLLCRRQNFRHNQREGEHKRKFECPKSWHLQRSYPHILAVNTHISMSHCSMLEEEQFLAHCTGQAMERIGKRIFRYPNRIRAQLEDSNSDQERIHCNHGKGRIHIGMNRNSMIS